MKVLFLDIDGVLVTSCSMMKYKNNFQFDEISFNLLIQIITLYDLKVVLSSTWRRFDHKMVHLERQILPFFQIYDKTPVLHTTRGKEIQMWLDRNTTEQFIILDDDSDMDHLSQYLVQTKHTFGLRNHHLSKIHNILTKK